MNTIYIGPSNIEKTILNELLKKDSFFNFKYIDIDEYISSFNTHSDDLNTVKNKLLKIKDSFSTYINIFNEKDVNDSFIKEVISIKDELVKYNLLFNLDINSLNMDDELKLILNNIDITYDFNLPKDASNINIINVNYSLINNAIISRLVDNGAKLYEPIKKDNESFIYKTRSIREEMEFVVQYIISKKINLNDCGVVLSDSSNINLFKSVLNHYHVPYSTNHRKQNSSALKAVAALDYIVNPSIETYQELVNSNLLVNANEYINRYLINHISNPNELFFGFNKYQNEDDKSYFKKVELEANKIHHKYIDFLYDIKDIKSFDLLFRRLVEVLPKNEDTKILVNKINTFSIDDCVYDNYKNIRNELLSLKEKQVEYESSLLITDLTKPIINKDYLFVLDVNSSNYPAFNPLSSILKEEDVLDTKYPTIKKRKENHLKILDYLNYSLQTIYVYPISSYEGKEQKLAYELSIRNLKELKFNIVTNTNEYTESHHITKNSITSNHIINNEIRGSVSKFETFVSCPYAYFAKYVLGLYEEDTKDVNAATVGTIMHAIMQTLVESKHKDYSNYTDDEIKQIISNDINELKFHYPNKLKLIDFMNERILKSFSLERDFLSTAELETEFVPSFAEKEIDFKIKTDSNVTINLHGIIDRIDTKDGYFRIIDYKTSDHKVNKKEFSDGKQLQLFTYAYVYTELTHKTPTGIFYLMLNHKSQTINYYKFSTKEGFVEVHNTEFKDFISKHKLHALAFTNVDGLYINPECITGYFKNGFGAEYTLDYGQMTSDLLKIYSSIIENILKGNFNPNYDKNKCTYCGYSTMCHNKYLKVEEEE